MDQGQKIRVKEMAAGLTRWRSSPINIIEMSLYYSESHGPGTEKYSERDGREMNATDNVTEFLSEIWLKKVGCRIQERTRKYDGWRENVSVNPWKKQGRKTT